MKTRNFIRPALFVVIIFLSLSGLLISSAQIGTQITTPSSVSFPRVFDVRGPDGVPQGLGALTPTAAQVTALTALQQQVGNALTVQYNGLTATPRHLFSHGTYLSAPGQGPAEAIAREFLSKHRNIFRLSQGDLSRLRLKSRATLPDTGVTILLFGQTVGGLPIYKGEVLVNVNRAGQVISVGGDSFPQVSIINSLALTPEQPLAEGYTISPEQAISFAAADLGVVGFTPQRAGIQKVPLTFGSAPRIYEDAPKFRRGVFGDDIVVSKVIFPLGNLGRLAYKFTLTTPQYNGIMWENIVDGQTGTVLRRASLTSFQSGGGIGTGRRGTLRPDIQDLVESQNTAATAQGKVTDTMPTALSGILGFGRSTAPGNAPSYQNPENFTPTNVTSTGRGFKLSLVNARNESPLIYNMGFGQVMRNFPDALNPSPWSPFGWFYLPTDVGGAEITIPDTVRTTTRDHGYNMHATARARNNSANSPVGDGSQPFAADLTTLSSPTTLADGRTLSSVFQSRYTEGNNVVVADDQQNDNETTHGVKGYAADRMFTAPYFDYTMSYEYGGVNATNSAPAPGLAATTVFPATSYPDVFPAAVTLFYYNNLLHDYLYSIGFTEALWNFQQDNFGRGGEGGDGVSAQVHDGSGVNNANFGTPADGGSPRMQMYLWSEDVVRRADGDFDFDVVAHEHYHGVSNRSAAKGDTGCLGLGVVVQFPSEAGGQGEGWSDFIAESLTDDDITGEFVTGEFDRGIRTLPMNNFRWSYGAINRRGLNRRDFPAPPDVNPSIVSTNPTNYPAFQVHHVGTIFAPMLWDMRELLIMKQKVGSAFPGIFFDGMRRLGTGASFFIGERQVQSVDTQHPINYRESFGTHAVVMPTPNPNSTPPNPGTAPLVVPNVKPADIVRPGELANEIQTLGNRQGPLATAVSLGGRLADTLVLRGLQLSPCNPSIVDTRDAILMADLELTGGENRAVIWRAFASHGVGALASSTAGTGADQGVPPPGSAATTTAPAVVEDFSVPAGVTACEQMGPLPAPTFSLSNTINNTVTISITAAVGANKYIIRRSNSASGPFTLVGETTSTTFNDNDGGSGLNINQTYYYEVRASRDAESNCISTATVQSITVTLGVVIEPAPIFAGVNLISDPRDGSRLIVSWNPASSINPDAQIVYDVFRKNTVQQGDGTQRASFTPSQADLIATVSGTSYNDVGLELGNVYYYVVQARDLENGTKDTNNVGNTVTRFNAPTVPFFAANPPFPLEDFETSAASGRFTPPLSEEGNNPDQATPIFQRITGEAFGGIPSVGKMYAPEFSPGHEATGCNPNPGGTSCGGQADYSAMIGPVALTPTSIMEFDHSFNSEEFFDGGVIEISIGDPSFSGSTPFPNNVTVFDAGNFIIESAYNSPLDGVLEEPVKLSILQGRLAYSGSQSQQHVRVALNDFAPGGTYNPNNQQVYIRLRNTSDAASAVGLDAGWYIDNLVINNLACFVNIAASSSGATASASSTHVDRNYSPGGAIDGDRTGFDWENGGGWNDGTRGVWPDWLQVNFSGNQTITQINIYTLQNDFRNPIEPTSATPADLYGIEDFQVQYWNGSTWVVVDDPTTTGVVEGDIVGNNKAMRVILIPSGIPTDKIRVHVTKGRVHYSRIVEVEAFGCSP